MPEASELKKAADPALYANACRTIRADGAYVAQGEDDTQTVQKLERDPNTIGLIGYSYLEENARQLRGVPIDGVAPTPDMIASGRYPGVRSLYLYVKKKHLKAVPELQAFLNLYTAMAAPGGPLTRHGLIASPQKLRARTAEAIQYGFPLDIAALP
jgi:phosphate transport system substrate-binding protein